jgi:hypothetical protein
MEDINIKKTAKTPTVNFQFNENHLEIKGISIPEDADTFYQPLLDWAEEYVSKKKGEETRIILRLIYFNTSTSDYLVTLLKSLRSLRTEQPTAEPTNGLEAEKASENITVETVEEINPTETENAENQLEEDKANVIIENMATDIVSEDSDVYSNEYEDDENKPRPIDYNHPLKIEWHYEVEDEDMRETGTHFESIIDIPFTFVPCEEIE